MQDWDMDPHWVPFDEVVEVCCAPTLLEPHGGMGNSGWTPEECLLRTLGDFTNAPRLEANYREWCEQQDPARMAKDSTKYTLVNHPTSETDQNFVRLELKGTKWSRVQACLSFFRQDRRNLYRIVDADCNQHLRPWMSLEKSELPHSLCLHGFVVTKDKKVLALQRPGPERTDYHPFTWSFSFEEQLAESDLKPNGETNVEAWLHRGVRQEVLGQEVDHFLKVDKCRLLAIAIEEPIFNPFLVAYIPLECTSNELRYILPHVPDRAEWRQFELYDLDGFLSDSEDGTSSKVTHLAEVFATGKNIDGNRLHPTSRYRLYLGLCSFLPSTINVPAILAR